MPFNGVVNADYSRTSLGGLVAKPLTAPVDTEFHGLLTPGGECARGVTDIVGPPLYQDRKVHTSDHGDKCKMTNALIFTPVRAKADDASVISSMEIEDGTCVRVHDLEGCHRYTGSSVHPGQAGVLYTCTAPRFVRDEPAGFGNDLSECTCRRLMKDSRTPHERCDHV
jgi:hypothetical protein